MNTNSRNLTLLTDEIIEFFKEYKFGISTSLDGNDELHNINRPFKNGEGTYKDVTEAISKLRNNNIHIGAIETTTKFSLNSPGQLVKTYVDMGFDSIFIRPLTKLGKATIGWEKIGYKAEQFIEFYRKATDELIELNKNGIFIKESHATIFLRKKKK